jgi:hypothetical protein
MNNFLFIFSKLFFAIFALNFLKVLFISFAKKILDFSLNNFFIFLLQLFCYFFVIVLFFIYFWPPRTWHAGARVGTFPADRDQPPVVKKGMGCACMGIRKRKV